MFVRRNARKLELIQNLPEFSTLLMFYDVTSEKLTIVTQNMQRLYII